MNKRLILWMDTETTGVDPTKHAIIQFAGIVEQNNKIIDEINMFIRPFKDDWVSKSALEKNNTTVEELRHSPKYVDACVALENLQYWMSEHVNRYDSTDKFIIAGKNVGFDVRFLRRWFEKCGDEFYGSWFWYPRLDLDNLIAEIMIAESDISFENFQLETICRTVGIEFKAHDAYEDIIATRKCYRTINGDW